MNHHLKEDLMSMEIILLLFQENFSYIKYYNKQNVIIVIFFFIVF